MTVQSGAVSERIAQIVVWAARAAWLAVAVVGGSALGDALDDRSRAVQITGTVAAWIGWAVGAGALAIAGVVTLTLARTIIPGSLVAAAVALAGGADPGSALLLVVPAVIAAALVGSAEFGRASTSRRRRTATRNDSACVRRSATSWRPGRPGC